MLRVGFKEPAQEWSPQANESLGYTAVCCAHYILEMELRRVMLIFQGLEQILLAIAGLKEKLPCKETFT